MLLFQWGSQEEKKASSKPSKGNLSQKLILPVFFLKLKMKSEIKTEDARNIQQATHHGLACFAHITAL